jgi:hypothetical protein
VAAILLAQRRGLVDQRPCRALRRRWGARRCRLGRCGAAVHARGQRGYQRLQPPKHLTDHIVDLLCWTADAEGAADAVQCRHIPCPVAFVERDSEASGADVGM